MSKALPLMVLAVTVPNGSAKVLSQTPRLGVQVLQE